MITIKDFSAQTGFSVRMLRYLEEFDLLKPARGENNYRYYHAGQVEAARKMRQIQNLGFQLGEIKSLMSGDWKNQVQLIENVHKREKEIAEAQSELLPRLLDLMNEMRKSETGLFEVLSKEIAKESCLEEDQKFQRTAYFIPELKLIYDDLETASGISFLEIDFRKFKDWLKEAESLPNVYSFLQESTFAFGMNLKPEFLKSFKESWDKYLREGELNEVEGFQLEDISQLMGSHDVVISAKFNDNKGNEGMLVIPYAPVFALAKR